MILTSQPESWKTYKRSLPDGYTVISSKEALDPKNKAVLSTARSFIDKNVKANTPIGHQEFSTINGKKYLFIVEPHYHEPGGKTKPWGWHHGATVFVPPVNDYWAFLYDDSPSMGFGVETIAKGKDLKTRLKRFAIPAALTALTIANPIIGGTITIGTIGYKHLHKKASPPFKGVPVSPQVHANSTLPL
jgi:hypothetical protein